MYKIGLIGCGNMGEAMLSGALKARWTDARSVVLHTRRDERMAELSGRYPGIVTVKDNVSVAQGASLIVLAVKPIQYGAILKKISTHISPGAVVLSLAPTFSIAGLRALIGREDVTVVRSMPNTPAMVGRGMTGVSFSEDTPEEHKERTISFLNSFGESVVVPESLMPAVGSVSGSSPAFIYMMIEALAQGAVRLGIGMEDALKFAAQSVEGAALMVKETGRHPAVLRDEVCSAGGTTIAGVASLERDGFNGLIVTAMEKTAKRFSEMEKETSQSE